MGYIATPNTSPNRSDDRLRANQLVAFGALSIGALLLVGPWLFSSLLVAAGVVCGRWWAKKGRFNGIKPSECKMFLDTSDITDIESHYMMYLGTTEKNTIRWWYNNSYLIPQAIDDGTVYWDKCIEIKDPILLRHLRGFYDMGNKWPEYYKTVIVPREKKDKEVTLKKKQKNKSRSNNYHGAPVSNLNTVEEWKRAGHPCTPIQAVPSDLPRADYADVQSKAKPATAAMAADAPLMELIKAVKDLETDATGSCPTIDFEGIST